VAHEWPLDPLQAGQPLGERLAVARPQALCCGSRLSCDRPNAMRHFLKAVVPAIRCWNSIVSHAAGLRRIHTMFARARAFIARGEQAALADGEVFVPFRLNAAMSPSGLAGRLCISTRAPGARLDHVSGASSQSR
jgi:hypothetical protein